MISVQQALDLILENSFFSDRKELRKLNDTLHYRLAENIFAPIDMPPFDQSSVDGFAVKFYEENKKWNVIGEIKAGDAWNENLNAGESVQIFTGAQVPASADAIIMQERIQQNENEIFLTEGIITKGECIRTRGGQLAKGKIALEKNHLINPASVGFLAGMGFEKINVISKPKINLIITGNELAKAGTTLKPGEIYDANSFVINAFLSQQNLEIHKQQIVHDEKEALRNAIDALINDSDILIISGGVSVGRYDFVKETLEESQVRTIFHRVAQRPGKPLYFGKKENTLVLGLPGNPASVLVCCYEYLLPMLRKINRDEGLFLNLAEKKLSADIKKVATLHYFMRGKTNGEFVEPLEGQESHMLKSFAEANCLMILPVEKEEFKAGEKITVHLLA
jgi:molybdopterin molybdotransferase